MKLVVESGATKSTWIVLDGDQLLDKQVLSGINPTSNPISLDVVDRFDSTYKTAIKSIDFYGAGLSAPQAKAALESRLLSHFGKRPSINIDTDIMAAARALSDDRASIVSILGTGMNSVVFDGSQIIHSPRSLGYLFGDYGSGFYIGKLIIQAYFNGKMTNEDAQHFKSLYIDAQEDLIFRIYKSDKPNFETAQLSKFLNNCSLDLKQEILKVAFSHFFENQVLSIDNHKSYPLNFVGSISMIFEPELRAVAKSYNLIIDNIVADPIDGLIDFYIKTR